MSQANLLQLQDGIKKFGARVLFDRARFAINEGEHVGVIGPNGAGKTTLFKILVGQESLDGGELVKSTTLNIGYLEQEAREPEGVSAEDFLRDTSHKPVWELKQLGLELGLREADFTKSFKDLSGGYRMRMKLLSLIGREPNLMLLDEPTNFLDLESIMALENYLQSYEGAFLLISHDREFLRRTTDHTLEVEAGEITKFPGHIDDYFEQKALMRSILEAQAANQEAKRRSVLEFVDRFGAKATKARQAQSRLKQLDKMERIEIKDLPVRAKIKIPEPIHTGREALALREATLGYGEKAVVSECNLRLENGTHLGVVGFNGAGKSTLLKSIASRIPLVAGQLKLGHQVTLSYYAQHVSDDLDPNDTVFESMEKAAHPNVDRQTILNLAGSLLFSGEAVHKRVKVLSGGEKSRVALGQILLRRSPLLLLDEPTNHLDFDTVEALTEALRDYAGTVIVVSHDRSFIGRVATQILEIRDGHAEIYPGTYDDYLWSLEKGSLKERFARGAAAARTSAAPVPSGPKTVASSVAPTGPRDQTKRYQAEVKESAKKLKKQEALLDAEASKLAKLNTEIVGAEGRKLQDLSAAIDQCYREVQLLEESILELMERQAEAESYLKK